MTSLTAQARYARPADIVLHANVLRFIRRKRRRVLNAEVAKTPRYGERPTLRRLPVDRQSDQQYLRCRRANAIVVVDGILKAA